jgi:predicted nuclease of restriction endonuclease-like (RecB) superfamily
MDKGYVEFIAELKINIVQSRYMAARLVNKEQLTLYFKTGKTLSEKIKAEKWGAKVIEQIATDLQRELPGIRGFSFTSLKNMRQFYETYSHLPFSQSLTGQLPSLREESFWGISFTHHILLINKCVNLYQKRGRLANNSHSTLPDNIKSTALEVFQDGYLFDFVALDDPDEKVFENALISDVKNMIMTLGKGFSFIANQYRLEVDGEEFFVDLLFFNRCTRSLVAFELKRGKFKPEYAGQLNFYLNVLDEKIRLPHENASIGIVLCKEKNNTVVEFAVKTIDKAMGVATYRTTREMPKEMQGILPDAAELAKLL